MVGRMVAGEVGRRRERWIAKSRDPRVFDTLNSPEVLALARVLTEIQRRYGDIGGYLRSHGMPQKTLETVTAILHQ